MLWENDPAGIAVDIFDDLTAKAFFYDSNMEYWWDRRGNIVKA
jgi:hypothetical protein